MLILFRTLSTLSANREWDCSIRLVANPVDKNPFKGCFLGEKLDQRVQNNHEDGLF